MYRCAPVAIILLAACAAPQQPFPLPVLARQSSGTTVLLQAVSAPSAEVAWVSGHRGTYVRTRDGGATWERGTVPGADTLQFRDVHAASYDEAWLLSTGGGTLSRIYYTADGGSHWTEQFVNADSAAFYDCLDFWDGRRGVAFSDGVDGRAMIRVTDDGGANWRLVPEGGAPGALPGEGAFAASGTCVVTSTGGRGWIGTGNGPTARVYRTTDFGRTWAVSESPIPSGEAAGIAAVAFRDASTGVVLGGPLGQFDAVTDNVAITRDGGVTWVLAGRPTFTGAVFGAAFAPGPNPTLVAVSPKGASASADLGMTWMPVDSAAYWGIGFSPEGPGYLVGPGGRITRVAMTKRR